MQILCGNAIAKIKKESDRKLTDGARTGRDHSHSNLESSTTYPLGAIIIDTQSKCGGYKSFKV